MGIENTIQSIFDPCLSIVKSVFDCRLPYVVLDINWFSKDSCLIINKLYCVQQKRYWLAFFWKK